MQNSLQWCPKQEVPTKHQKMKTWRTFTGPERLTTTEESITDAPLSKAVN